MNFASWLLWGFVATVANAILLHGSQGLGLTRLNLPYILGMAVTPDRDKARLYGFLIHTANGWLFSLLYVFIFESLQRTSWWLGALIGIGHALFLLVVVFPVMPGLHPRMASEQHGPSASRMLEPPGFMALNYGLRTPVSVLVAHIVFGIILGVFYHLK
ncbi:MAG TPA: hypothetical protein VLV49_17300 [Terriglobales bacterium]|nr:hypothetical protein [Terriglobales bacterium]